MFRLRSRPLLALCALVAVLAFAVTQADARVDGDVAGRAPH
jgi:hypothetical protein